ncbi:hypothetical protein HDU97_003212 [Phlyctochytrium planicorne]|nr:hypothetical protein HDU97_003212 [Phlyctochytrium planicorne]
MTVDAIVVRSDGRLSTRDTCNGLDGYHCCYGTRYDCDGIDACTKKLPIYIYFISAGVTILFLVACYFGWRYYQKKKREESAATRAAYVNSQVVHQAQTGLAPVAGGDLPVYHANGSVTLVGKAAEAGGVEPVPPSQGAGAHEVPRS